MCANFHADVPHIAVSDRIFEYFIVFEEAFFVIEEECVVEDINNSLF